MKIKEVSEKSEETQSGKEILLNLQSMFSYEQFHTPHVSNLLWRHTDFYRLKYNGSS